MAYYKKGDTDRAKAGLEKALNLDANFKHAAEAKKVLAEL
jgi:Tfp pilus assembly protein PilF